jgi:hypothetical protein
MCKFSDEVTEVLAEFQGRIPGIIRINLECEENPKPLELPTFLTNKNGRQ